MTNTNEDSAKEPEPKELPKRINNPLLRRIRSLGEYRPSQQAIDEVTFPNMQVIPDE